MNRIYILLTITTIFVLGLYANQIGQPHTFKNDLCQLTVTQYKANSSFKTDGGKIKVEHDLKLKGLISPIGGFDISAIGTKMRVIQATDKDGNSLLLTTDRFKPIDASKNKFNLIINGDAEANAKIELNSNAYQIDKMKLSTEVLIAQTRDSGQLPCKIMSEHHPTAGGVNICIKQLTTTTSGTLKISLSYQRRSDKLGTPYIETIECLDKDGKLLVSGRPSGNCFAKKGSITSDLEISTATNIKDIRFMIVTEYESKTIAFEIDKIFQK